MAKGRFLSITIAHDRRFNSLSAESALLFLMTIPHLDRDGMILYGDGPELWAQVCPRRPDLLLTISGLVQEWLRLSLVTLHETNDGYALRFEGFHKNQQGMRYEREGISRFGVAPTSPGVSPDKLRSNSGVTPAQVQGQEQVQEQVQGECEGQGQDSPPANPNTHTQGDKPPAIAFSSDSRTDAQKRVMQAYQDTVGQPIWNAPKKVKWLDEMTASAGEERMKQLIAEAGNEIRAGTLIAYNALGALSERLKASHNGKQAPPKKGTDRFALNYDPATVVSGITEL